MVVSMMAYKKKRRIKRAKEMPATVGMLDELRGELKSDITALLLEMRAGFKAIESRFDKVDARFAEIESRFDKVDARFAEMESRFDKVDARFAETESKFKTIDSQFLQINSQLMSMQATNHRTLALVEAQHNENRFAMDQLDSFNRRILKLEGEPEF